MQTLTFACSCGSVRGTLNEASPDKGSRVVCYCSDCQAFEEFLGRTETVLDAKGGADVYQTLPHRVTIEAGAEHLAAVRMTDGRLLRWYTACCKTPIGSTPDIPGVPMIGLLTAPFLWTQGPEAELAFGLSKGVLFPKEAWSAPEGPRASLPGLALAAFGRALGAKLSGKAKRSPFFSDDKRPVAEPRLIEPEERAAINARLAARHAA
jgi:hypothetical protein